MYNRQESLPQQQGLEKFYNQGQQIPMQTGISQTNRAINLYSRSQAEGPSFTGRASVFGQPSSESSHKEQSRPTRSPSSEKISFDRIKRSKSPRTREARHIEMYNIESNSRSRSQDDRSRRQDRSRSRSRTNRSVGEKVDFEHHRRSRRRSRSLSPGNDSSSWGDTGARGNGNGNKAEEPGKSSRTAQQQLERTLNRLQQLEQQQHLQDQLLKDMQMQLEEPSAGKHQEKQSASASFSGKEGFHNQQISSNINQSSTYNVQQPQHYSSQSSKDGLQREKHTPGYGHVGGGVTQGSDLDPHWRSDHHGASRDHTRRSSDDFGFRDQTKPSTDLVCYRCDRYGHIAADCTEPRPKEEVKTCYVCRRKGHIAADCLELKGTSKCYRCEQPGHLAKDCRVPDYKLNPSTMKCYRCEQPGHLVKDCRVPEYKPNSSTIKCYRCEQPGHLVKDCRVPEYKPNSSTIKCYRCEQPGHLVKDCRVPEYKPNSNTMKCYRCEQPGHLAKDCKVPDYKLKPKVELSDSQPRCYNCGGIGHLAKYCCKQAPETTGQDRDKSNRRCYSCDGWGHFHMDCPTKGNQTSSISCNHCNRVGHKSINCYSRPKSTSSARAGVSSKDSPKSDSKRIDAETTLMVEGVFTFSKTKYPVPEGCMTRLEIDDRLKRQSTLHGIRESDIPAAPSQAETTLANQAALLVRLNWKTMLYDREVENLSCLLCDKGFSGFKQYQAHVNGKEPHLNLYNVLLNAKCGWAVRTKMLKKICKLPSIFEDPPPGASPKPYPDIKPQLLNGTKKKKFFFCRVCQSWGETPLKSHFESKRHKYLYEKQWKCDFCNMYFKNYQDFTKHAKTSIIHKQVTGKLVKNVPLSSKEEKKLGKDTTPSMKRSLLDDKQSSVPKKKSKYATRSSTEGKDADFQSIPEEERKQDVVIMDTKKSSDTAEEDVDVLGLQFLVPVTGFYCKICNKFYNKAKVGNREHCHTKQHLSKVKAWYQKNKKSLKKSKCPPIIDITSDKASIDKDKHPAETGLNRNSPKLVIIEDTEEKKDNENSVTENTIADEPQYVVVDDTEANNDVDMKENVEEIAEDGEDTPSSTTENPTTETSVTGDQNQGDNFELLQHTKDDKEKDDSTDIDADCNVAMAESRGNLEDAYITGEDVDEEKAADQIQGYDTIPQEDTDTIAYKKFQLQLEDLDQQEIVDVEGVDALEVVADVTKHYDVSVDVIEDEELDFVDIVDSENEDTTSLNEAAIKDKTYTARQVKVESYDSEVNENEAEGKNKVDDKEAKGENRVDKNKANEEEAENKVDKELSGTKTPREKDVGSDNVNDANADIVSGSVDASGTSKVADSVEEKTKGNTKKRGAKGVARVTQTRAAKKPPKKGKKGGKN